MSIKLVGAEDIRHGSGARPGNKYTRAMEKHIPMLYDLLEERSEAIVKEDVIRELLKGDVGKGTFGALRQGLERGLKPYDIRVSQCRLKDNTFAFVFSKLNNNK